MSAAALALALLALVVGLILLAQVAQIRRRLAAVPADRDLFTLLKELDTDLGKLELAFADLAPRVASLEARLPLAISRTGVVHYDAFGDIAGNLSRSIALLNDRGDGVVITLLVGRDETRFFTKQVQGATGREPLSPEEQEAVAVAMGA